MRTIISVIAVLGVGSIVAAFISWRVAISNHRQAWIDAVREDLATYLKQLEAIHYSINDERRASESHGILETKKAAAAAKREARLAILFTYWRIVLRLNRTEPLHNELRKKLDDLMVVSEKVPNRTKIEEAIDLSRRILKQEWEVTKFGVLAPLISRIKVSFRKSLQE